MNAVSASHPMRGRAATSTPAMHATSAAGIGEDPGAWRASQAAQAGGERPGDRASGPGDVSFLTSRRGVGGLAATDLEIRVGRRAARREPRRRLVGGDPRSSGGARPYLVRPPGGPVGRRGRHGSATTPGSSSTRRRRRPARLAAPRFAHARAAAGAARGRSPARARAAAPGVAGAAAADACRAPPAAGGEAGPHRIDAGQRLVQDQREREQVGGRAGEQPLGLLGRHVGGGPDDVAGARQRVAAEHAGDAEVGQPGQLRGRCRALGNQHVGGLDVAVDHALGMGVGERVAQRDPDLDDVAIRQPARLQSRRASRRGPARRPGRRPRRRPPPRTA